MTAMKKRMILATLSSLLLCMAACSNKQLPTSEDILTEARAVKTLNAYDEMNCVVHFLAPEVVIPVTVNNRHAKFFRVLGDFVFPNQILFFRQFFRSGIGVYPAKWWRLPQ